MTTYKRYDPIGMEIGYLMSLGMPFQAARDSVMSRWHYELLFAVTMRRICNREGHKIQDNSYGNPETGCVDLDCVRCGWSHHVTLY